MPRGCHVNWNGSYQPMNKRTKSFKLLLPWACVLQWKVSPPAPVEVVTLFFLGHHSPLP